MPACSARPHVSLRSVCPRVLRVRFDRVLKVFDCLQRTLLGTVIEEPSAEERFVRFGLCGIPTFQARLLIRDQSDQALAIGRNLNVDVVLTGEIRTHQGELKIRAELIDVASEGQLWGERFDRSLDDSLAVEKEITTRILNHIQIDGDEKARLQRRYPAKPEAHEAFLRGQFLDRSTTKGALQAVTYFEDAIEADPQYARAHAALANMWTVFASWHATAPQQAKEKAVKAALEALRLDPLEPEAHNAMGFVKVVFEWKWDEAEKVPGRHHQVARPRYTDCQGTGGDQHHGARAAAQSSSG